MDLQLSTVNGRGAVGNNSLVAGVSNNATGNSSVAFGNGTNADGNNTFVFGEVQSGGNVITASGPGIQTSGSFVHGYVSDGGVISVSGPLAYGSTSHGYAFNTATITSSGAGALAQGIASFGTIIASGNGSIASGDASGTLRSSGIGSLANGNASTGILESTSDGAHALGNVQTLGTIAARNYGSHASGFVTNSGQILATGSGSYASGSAEGSTAQILASGIGAYASGTATNGQITALGVGSYAAGEARTSTEVVRSSGSGCITSGRNLQNGSEHTLLIGQHGIAKTPTSVSGTINSSNSIQVAGGAVPADSIDGISVVIGTSVQGWNPTGGGIANFWATSGADYAEYFEWSELTKDKEGNYPSEDDSVGKFVAHSDGKIVFATNKEELVGIVSARFGEVGVVGDSAELHWKKANIVDKFGRLQYKLSIQSGVESTILKHKIIFTEEIKDIINKYDNAELLEQLELLNKYSRFDQEIEKELDDEEKDKLFKDLRGIVPVRVALPNPDFDKTKEYIPRSSRPEWALVSLLGKVRVRDNGLCKVGSRCTCENGIAVPGKDWIVLERITEDVIRILYK